MRRGIAHVPIRVDGFDLTVSILVRSVILRVRRPIFRRMVSAAVPRPAHI